MEPLLESGGFIRGGGGWNQESHGPMHTCAFPCHVIPCTTLGLFQVYLENHEQWEREQGGGGGRGRDLSFIRLPSISYFITAIQHRLIHTSAPVTANASSVLSLGLTFTLPLIPASPISVKLVVSTLEAHSGSD